MIPPTILPGIDAFPGWSKKRLPQEADRRILLDHRVEAVLKQATSCHSGWPLLGMVNYPLRESPQSFQIFVGKKNPRDSSTATSLRFDI